MVTKKVLVGRPVGGEDEDGADRIARDVKEWRVDDAQHVNGAHGLDPLLLQAEVLRTKVPTTSERLSCCCCCIS